MLPEFLRFEQRATELKRAKCRGMAGHLLFFESLGSQAGTEKLILLALMPEPGPEASVS